MREASKANEIPKYCIIMYTALNKYKKICKNSKRSWQLSNRNTLISEQFLQLQSFPLL